MAHPKRIKRTHPPLDNTITVPFEYHAIKPVFCSYDSDRTTHLRTIILEITFQVPVFTGAFVTGHGSFAATSYTSLS